MKYAILSDVHGNIEALDAVLDECRARSVEAYASLGDIVGYGPNPNECVKRIVEFDTDLSVKGNHDDEFLGFLADETRGPDWFPVGGDAPVYSYGVRIPRDIAPADRFSYIRKALRAAVPPRHVEFLAGLELVREIGDYLFVHAGIRPGTPLDEQDPEDMLWIRDEFLDSRADHGKVVVHGHSVTDRPDVRENRIGIDTGAYASHVLTCLVLEGATRRFLSTA